MTPGVRSIYTTVCVNWFFINIIELKVFDILLRISFDPTPYRRVITVTGYIQLLYRGATVVKVPITAYSEPLNEDHQDLPTDWMELN